MVGIKVKVDVAPSGNIHGVAECTRIILKCGMHLCFGFKIKLVGSEFKSLVILDCFAGLNAQQHIMGTHIFFTQIVAVVTGHQGDRKPLAHVQKYLIDLLLLLEAVILHLQKKIIRTENFKIFTSRLLSLLDAPLLDVTWNFTMQASTQSDKALAAFFEDLFIYARLIIEAV